MLNLMWWLVGALALSVGALTGDPVLLMVGVALSGHAAVRGFARRELIGGTGATAQARRLYEDEVDSDIAAVLMEFDHRTAGFWLDRDPMWLAEDTAWLDSELDHVLGLKRRPVVDTPCHEWVDGEMVQTMGCPHGRDQAAWFRSYHAALHERKREVQLRGYLRARLEAERESARKDPEIRRLDWAGALEVDDFGNTYSPLDTDASSE